MKLLLSIIVVVFTAIIIYFFVLAYLSKSNQPLGMVDNMLAPCPQKPNCVCSEYSDDVAHFVMPINVGASVSTLPHTPDDILIMVKEAVVALGGKLQPDSQKQQVSGFYLAATFTSSFFGFIDDVELRFDIEHNVLHLRSASRVGHSDFNANRKRINRLKENINQRLFIRGNT